MVLQRVSLKRPVDGKVPRVGRDPTHTTKWIMNRGIEVSYNYIDCPNLYIYIYIYIYICICTVQPGRASLQVSFWTSGRCLCLSPQNTPIWHRWSRARKVRFPDFSEDMFLKSKMEPVVKYCVYSDILLRAPIYMTKCWFSVNTRKSQDPPWALLGNASPPKNGFSLHPYYLPMVQTVSFGKNTDLCKHVCTKTACAKSGSL